MSLSETVYPCDEEEEKEALNCDNDFITGKKNGHTCPLDNFKALRT
ncbi:hypothetical protein L4C33_22625 [Vibrio makurazakiensis]